MKSPRLLSHLAGLLFFAVALPVFSQGTAFTYQGRLNDNGTLASGKYDLVLGVYDNSTGGNLVGGSNTFAGITISNGLFTVIMDPGTNVFNTASRWLQVSARTNASGAYTNLAPRTLVTPSPLAIFAENAGSVSAGVTLTNVTATGTFSGNGNGLVGLNGGAIVTGSILSNAIANGQVVRSIDGLRDDVVVAGGNNIFLTTNGNTLTVLTAPGLLSWIPVPSATTQLAAVNKGYLFNADAQVNVTLPASPALGDIVRVSSSGIGGWRISQNVLQSVRLKNLPGNIGVNWTGHNPSLAWTGIASSEDGLKLVAVANNVQIQTSIDGGTNWTGHESARPWTAVASSIDGNRLVATVSSGMIYTSTNAGVSWSAHSSNLGWISVASSADGKIMAAATAANVYFTTDSGFTWTPTTLGVGGHVALSADGQKVVLAGSNGQLYTSPDIGVTWTPHAISAGSVASSADGVNLVAAGGQLYTSTDSGVTWTVRDVARSWGSVASSANGTRLAATVTNGQLYNSTDSGRTWTAREAGRNWSGITSSADGTRLAACVNGAQIFTSDNGNPITTIGTAGYLLGDQYSAIELQFVGYNASQVGQFIPLSHEGFIGGY